MPEGPEIRLAADRVAKAVVGRPLAAVSFAFEQLQPFEEPLTDARVLAVDTRGKAMLTRFSCSLTVYSHNQLYGRWMVGRAEPPPKTTRSLRFAMIGHTKAARLYSASSIDVVPTDEIEQDPRIAKLGPDALDLDVTPVELLGRLQSKTFKNRQLGGLLLDQRFVAGLGNYLRSDILNGARVHPSMRPRDLDPGALERIATLTLGLTRRSYKTRGVTNDDARVAALKDAGASRRDYRHLAYGRARRRCYVCESVIERMEHGGRAVFVCPTCQPTTTT